MKITDLKIGEFATRNKYLGNKKSLCVKRYSEEKYEYWENGQFSLSVRKDSSIFHRNDFKLCDCNGKLIEEFTYPLFSESKQKFSEPITGVDYASQPDISFVPQDGVKSRLHDDALDDFSYTNHVWKHLHKNTGATEVVNNLNQTKEFTMNNELKEAILELIATNGKPKVKKPETPKIVCNVEGTLMEFANEAALKQFMWSSRVESVIRYDLTGKVTVPFELSIEAPKKQKQTKVTE